MELIEGSEKHCDHVRLARSLAVFWGFLAATASSCGEDETKNRRLEQQEPREGQEDAGPDASGAVIRDDASAGVGSTDDAAADGTVAPSEPDHRCPPAFASARDASPALLMLVVDISNSMNESAGGAMEPTKWEVAQPELERVVTELPNHVAAGMVFYPGSLENHCFSGDISVPIDWAASEHRQELIDEIQAVRPYGGTATHDAYHLALEALKESELMGERAVLVVTDGQPNYSLGCEGDGDTPVDNTPLIEEAARALEDGVRTFVLGVPGSEAARTDLSALARAGGSGGARCSDEGSDYCHLDLTTGADLEQGLRQALARLTSNAARCQFVTPEAPEGFVFDPERSVVTVRSGDEELRFARGDRDGCSEGWEPGASAGTFRQCDDSCQELQRLTESGEVDIQVSFECE